MALVLVLWVMVLLCAVALDVKFSTHLRLQVTASTGGATKAHFLARAGVERAVADLVAGRDRVQAAADLREGDGRAYRSVELGEGTYTLYAGMDDGGSPVYGIADEAAKINLNTADADTLGKVPGIGPELAALMVALRKLEACHDVDDLLLLENVDPLTLYGEDQNNNGLLDANEDDGEQSWPPDNADGRLDGGLAAHLTTWSAARDVTADGESRVNLNSAKAEELVKSISGLAEQEADSIVAHREKNKFGSIANLLDVELVERVVEQPQGNEKGQGKRERTPKGNGPEQPTSAANPTNKKTDRKGTDKDAGPGEGGAGDRSQEAGNVRGGDDKPKVTLKGTGKKAFDLKAFRRIADLVTVQEKEVLEGLVNVNTASYEVLACLPGLDEALARAIVHERESRGEGFATTADLLDVDGLSTEAFKKVCAHVSARSDVFGVRSFGVLGAGDLYCCVYAVIDRTESTVSLRYWRETE